MVASSFRSHGGTTNRPSSGTNAHVSRMVTAGAPRGSSHSVQAMPEPAVSVYGRSRWCEPDDHNGYRPIVLSG